MKIAIYARVSIHNGQNPEMQLRELREYCWRREWDIAREYVDVGISGRKEKRPELDQLLQVFKKYSQMKLRMKREALNKINRRANEMPAVLARPGSGERGFDTVLTQ